MDEEERYVDNDLEQTQQNIVNTTANVAKSGKDAISDINNKRKERKKEKEKEILGDDAEKKKFVGPDKKIKGTYYAKKGELINALGKVKRAEGNARHAIGTSQRATAAKIRGAATLLGLLPYVGPSIRASLNSTAKKINQSGKKNQKYGKEKIEQGNEKIKEGRHNIKRGLKLKNTGEDIGSYGSKSTNDNVKGAGLGVPNANSIISKQKRKFNIKALAQKKKKIILISILVLFLCITFLILMLISSEEKEGEYREGDNSNVPYVLNSQVMNALTIVEDGSGGFKYAFTDSEGNIVDFDTVLDNALKTLEDNKSSALGDMGKNDKERKELLKKLVQAEIATQYPDLSISGKSGSSSNAVNGVDFCVDTSNTNSMPVLNEEQLTQIVNNSDVNQQGKENMLSVVPDLVKFQEQYKVNAVFFMAVAYTESGWGSNWDYIDPSTYNWISIQGSNNGGYVDYNGTSWNVYTSYSDAAEYFFKLISDPGFVYFGGQKYTVYDIAPTYCNIEWGDAVSKYIQNYYSLIGITPNSADNSTSSGEEKASSTKTDTSSDSENTSKDANSETNDSNKGDTVTNNEIGWLWTISFENFSAYLYHHNNSRVNYTDLYVQGYITEDRKNYIVTTTGGNRYAGPGVQLEGNRDLFAELGVDVGGLSAGSLIDCDIVEQVSLKAYNNLLEKAKSDASSQGCSLSDTQAHAVTDAYYLNGPYSSATNFGSLYTQYGDTDNLANNYIGFSLVDSAENANSRAKCTWALFHFGKYHSVDSNFNAMVESGEIDGLSAGDANIPGGGSKGELQGVIRIKRKSEDGKTKILTYTDPDTFQNMISSKNPNVMNYYTLKKNTMTSGTGTNSNINLTGDEAKEQIFNFLVDSGATPEGAAGLMGNLEAESGCKSVRVQGDYSYSNPEEYSASYTSQVDDGTISEDDFVYRGPNGGGYGLAQWTATNRKQNLYNYAKSKGTSIGDLQTQLEFLVQELQSGYSSIWNMMTTSNDMKSVSNIVLHSFENPASQGSDVENLRYSNGKAIYDLYAEKRKSAESSSSKTTQKDEKNDDNSKKNNSKKSQDSSKKNEDDSKKSQDDSNKNQDDSSTNSDSKSDKTNEVNNFDDFLFIGDSRYNGISTELSGLGNNITAIGIDSSRSDEWATITKNGSGSAQGKSVDLPSSAKGVSVMIGVNSLSQIEETEQILENLHTKYPSATIYYNSIYHVAGNYNVSGITASNMNANIDSFNNTLSEYCKDKDWVEYIDVTDNLNDENGLLKNADSMGVHLTGEGKTTLVENIKNAILKSGKSSSSNTQDSQSVNSANSQYLLLVANETRRHTKSVDSYEYAYTTLISTSSGTQGLTSQRNSTPADSVSEDSTTVNYTVTTLDYQAAVRDYTLHFDFLWAIFVSTRDKDFVSEWANEALNSKIDITVFSQEQTVENTSSTMIQPTYLRSEDGTTVYQDCFNTTRTTTITTTTITSKPGITYADVWMLKYENDPLTYAEYSAKSSEVVEEKLDTDTGIMSLIKNKERLRNLKTRYYLVERMIDDNEKVSFMADIYKYVLEKARGKVDDETGIFDIINVGSFDIRRFSKANGEGSRGGEQTGESGDGYTSVFVVGTRTYKNYKQQQGSYCGDSLAGFENTNISNAGCAITAIAVLVSGYGIDMGPGEVNAYAKTTSTPTCHNITISGILGKQTSSHTSGDFSQIIIDQLNSGRPCMARTSYYSASHYIDFLAISDDGNEVYVSDPGGDYPGSDRNGWQPISFLQRVNMEVITIDE